VLSNHRAIELAQAGIKKSGLFCAGIGVFAEIFEIFEKSCNFSHWNASINTGTPVMGRS